MNELNHVPAFDVNDLLTDIKTRPASVEVLENLALFNQSSSEPIRLNSHDDYWFLHGAAGLLNSLVASDSAKAIHLAQSIEGALDDTALIMFRVHCDVHCVIYAV